MGQVAGKSGGFRMGRIELQVHGAGQSCSAGATAVLPNGEIGAGLRAAGRTCAVLPVAAFLGGFASCVARAQGEVAEGGMAGFSLTSRMHQSACQVVQLLAVGVESMVRQAQQSAGQVPACGSVGAAGAEPVLPRQSGSGRACRREIGDGEVGFVADAADDGNGAGGYRARHDFFVKRPQVFNAAATPAQDQHVAFGSSIGRFAVQRQSVQRHPHPVPASGIALPVDSACGVEGGEHIAQCSGLKRGDNADTPRESGQAAFARGIKQAFCSSLVLSCSNASNNAPRPARRSVSTCS